MKNNKFLAKSHRKLARSQKKLKRAFRKLGQPVKKAKNAENPAWVTALAAMAGAIATALTDRGKRSQLADIAKDVKKKATGLLPSSNQEADEVGEGENAKLNEPDDEKPHHDAI